MEDMGMKMEDLHHSVIIKEENLVIESQVDRIGKTQTRKHYECGNNNLGWSQNQIALLIDQYSKHQCLYAVKHKDYHNRRQRRLALKQIVDRLKDTSPLVTEHDVQKKFLGLRTTYCNVRKKVLQSINDGAGEDDVLKPSLWYYDNMAFLNDSLEIRMHKPSFANSRTESQEEPDVLDNCTIEDYDVPDNDLVMSSTTSSTSRTSSVQSPVINTVTRKRKRRNKTVDAVIRSEVSKNLEKMNEILKVSVKGVQNHTHEDAFANYVGAQLKRIVDVALKNEVEHAIQEIIRNAISKEIENKNL